MEYNNDVRIMEYNNTILKNNLFDIGLNRINFKKNRIHQIK